MKQGADNVVSVLYQGCVDLLLLLAVGRSQCWSIPKVIWRISLALHVALVSITVSVGHNTIKIAQ